MKDCRGRHHVTLDGVSRLTGLDPNEVQQYLLNGRLLPTHSWIDSKQLLVSKTELIEFCKYNNIAIKYKIHSDPTVLLVGEHMYQTAKALKYAFGVTLKRALSRTHGFDGYVYTTIPGLKNASNKLLINLMSQIYSYNNIVARHRTRMSFRHLVIAFTKKTRKAAEAFYQYWRQQFPGVIRLMRYSVLKHQLHNRRHNG